MSPPDPAVLEDFARRYTAAWCSRDPAQVAAFFSSEGSLKVNESAPATGRDAITAVAAGFMMAFPDLQVLMNRVKIDGSQAEYHWTLAGTNSGPGGTGNPVRISGCEVWQFGTDGLVAKSIGSFDGAEYQRQLGRGA